MSVDLWGIFHRLGTVFAIGGGSFGAWWIVREAFVWIKGKTEYPLSRGEASWIAVPMTVVGVIAGWFVLVGVYDLLFWIATGHCC